MNWTVVFIVILIVCNVILWLLFMPWYVNRKITRFQNDLVDRHYAEVEMMYRKMRGWRHDYRNHIQTLKAHMSMGQYVQVEEYLDCLEKDLEAIDTMIKSGNVAVDAILNSKLSLMREKQISVDVRATVPERITISGMDLSVLIGNMLDNAMEACMKLPKEERYIRIYIDIIKNEFYIIVTNSMKGKAKKSGRFYLSSKKGVGHGFGLLRINSIVRKYYGYINRQSENGVFATEVMLPLIR